MCLINGMWYFMEFLLGDLEECLILVIFYCKVNNVVFLINYNFFIVWINVGFIDICFVFVSL